ncbi:MAG TPA: hypothetical protein VMT99_00970 [Candidatus Paceibacterota bacterium]|nr:hypothetical protein [Candidatus Paceibacterota bacterium]
MSCQNKPLSNLLDNLRLSTSISLIRAKLIARYIEALQTADEQSAGAIGSDIDWLVQNRLDSDFIRRMEFDERFRKDVKAVLAELDRKPQP